MSRASKIYEDMWRQSWPLISKGQVETDPLIGSEQDTRRGLTLLFRPPAPVVNHTRAFLREARCIEPNQYYYPEEDIHLTILSIISCYPGFSLDRINPQEYEKLIGNAVKLASPFRLVFTGITASPGAIMVQGFDESGNLNKLRHQLRENFKSSGLEHSIDRRYRIRTAHLTVVRFSEPLKAPEPFSVLARKHRSTNFGACQVRELELVFNDWYQRKEITQRVSGFSLEP